MFKRPLRVEFEAHETTVNHEINVDYKTVIRAERMISHAGKTAIAVIAVAALAKTSSEIVTHIFKTQIK